MIVYICISGIIWITLYPAWYPRCISDIDVSRYVSLSRYICVFLDVSISEIRPDMARYHPRVSG